MHSYYIRHIVAGNLSICLGLVGCEWRYLEEDWRPLYQATEFLLCARDFMVMMRAKGLEFSSTWVQDMEDMLTIGERPKNDKEAEFFLEEPDIIHPKPKVYVISKSSFIEGRHYPCGVELKFYGWGTHKIVNSGLHFQFFEAWVTSLVTNRQAEEVYGEVTNVPWKVVQRNKELAAICFNLLS